MSGNKTIVTAKFAALTGFLTLLVCTYYLRSEVLALSHIRFSADELRATNDLKRLRESYPDRVQQHELAMKHYELEQQHYQKMLELYENSYEEYVKRIEAEFKPPPLPVSPMKPDPPEIAQQFYEINAAFRTRKNQYFARTSRLNWIACVAALMLAGGLMFLLMFDTVGVRWHYLAALLLSFTFLIGPALHSILSGIIGFLEEPRVY